MKNITINYAKKTIEITKSFEKKAREYGSDAYKALRDARNEFEGYELVVKTSKSSNTFKGMDYDFMVEYISKQENADEIMADFHRLRENELSYGEIKQWFVEKFPVFTTCTTRAQWILAA